MDTVTGVAGSATTSPAPAAEPTDARAGGAIRHAPVIWWAVVGAIALVFQAYLMIRWVSGPYFKRVPSGPSVPPAWMRVALISGEIISPLIAAGCIYRLLVRPWRARRVVTTDGLFCLAFLAIVWQDPISNYFAPYLTYNSYLLNMGSWVQGIPGWQTAGHPGAMTVDPVLYSAPNYIFAPLFMMFVGAWLMNGIRRRRPNVSNIGLVAILTAAWLIFWPVIEAGLYTPLGFFAFPGGQLSIFPDAYHKYPLTQVLCASAFMMAFTALRYFSDADGHTIAERGVDRLRTGFRGKVGLRLLALVGISNVIYLCTYNIPLAVWTDATTGAWPRDLQSRSYLTDRLCGADTRRVCPYSAAAGPHVVPFGSGGGAPFSGPVLGETR